MKKCVLSATTLMLMIQSSYAMDGVEPAVDVDAPMLEVIIAEEPPTTGVEPIELLPTEAEVQVEVLILPITEPLLEAESQEVPKDENVDPNSVDLASQSGVVVEGGETRVIAVEDHVVLNDGETQPHFRSLTGAPQGEEVVLAATGTARDPSADAEPQLLNDEQRGSVRGLRVESDSAKPKSGMSKLMAKFRKPQARISQASHTETDKTLAGQLAQIDRMRDTALRTGDLKMLEKAAALEKQIRAKAPARTR